MKTSFKFIILALSVSISANSQIIEGSKSLEDLDGNMYPIYPYR